MCGWKNAAVRDSRGWLVREAYRENFYPGNREVGGACSEWCTWWDAAYFSSYEEYMPFWAKQYTMTRADHYAFVTALALPYGLRGVVHLELGYNLRIGNELRRHSL